MATATESDLELGLEILTEGRRASVPRLTTALSAPKAAFALEAVGHEKSALEVADELQKEARGWTHGRGIEGVGIGDKLTMGEPAGELALRVYVDKKKPRAKLRNPVPKTVVIPGVGELATDVIEIGKIVPEVFTERVRPAMPGSGVGHRDVSVGTFGCLVRKKGDSETLYILSNAHVLANGALGQSGDVIVQPGKYDGGSVSDDFIAELTDFVPFSFTKDGFPNLVDAAIAKVKRRSSVNAALRILNITPVGVGRTLRRGMHVKKVGRTTDYTTGVIQDIHFRLSLQYRRPSGNSTGRVGFKDQVLCTRYSAGGDSGAVILNSSDRIVGLHFAGSPSGSIFNRIKHVLTELDVEVA